MQRSRIALLLLLAAWPPDRLTAWQCPDGTPLAQCRRPVEPNPDVIVVLPFRVGGADPALAYLRDGMVELLAPQFDGRGGPTAVDPSDALREWAAAGGGRAPLSRAALLAIARRLGAGQLLTGAVVGSQRRITVTASVVGVPRGEVLVRSVTVSGPSDSLAALVSDLSGRLLGLRAGAWRLTATDAGTLSTDALRAYVAGRGLWRAGRAALGAIELDRALSLDSTFVLAAYWLSLAPGLAVAAPNPDRAFRLAWRQRDRLTAEQQAFLAAQFGPGGPGTTQSQAAMLAGIERAARAMPRSWEAWMMVADRYFHRGALLGYEDWARRSRAAFARSLEIDSTAGALGHLATLALVEGDGREHARLVAALSRFGTNTFMHVFERYAGAVRQALPSLAADRTRFASIANSGYPWATAALLPAAEQELLLRLAAEREPTAASVQPVHRAVAISVLRNLGQHARADSVARLQYGGDSVQLELDMLLAAESDSIAVARLARRSLDLADSLAHTVQCEIALARLRRDDTTGTREAAASLRAAPRAELQLCALLIDAIVATRHPSADPSPLLRADSVMRSGPEGLQETWNYDVAVALARRGDWPRAAAAAQRRTFALVGTLRPPGARLAIALRDGGRWAARAGDTTAAIRAMRQYLLLRENPAAALLLERDSIRAELARLERK